MDEYLGFKEVQLSGDDVETILHDSPDNIFGCANNEYIAVKDEYENVIGVFKCVNDKLRKVSYKTINTRFLGKIKPRNIQQQMAIDMLYDSDTTVKIITGKFGTGKDFLMCAAAVDLLEHGKFEKIVYVRNNIEVKDSKPIGFLPGSYNEKLLPFAMPLADNLGGVDGLSLMIGHGNLEIVQIHIDRSLGHPQQRRHAGDAEPSQDQRHPGDWRDGPEQANYWINQAIASPAIPHQNTDGHSQQGRDGIAQKHPEQTDKDILC